MTREEALKQADIVLEELLRSGDEKLFEEARGPNGQIDTIKLAMAAASAREKIADKIQRGEM